jgi:hypothetical protein
MDHGNNFENFFLSRMNMAKNLGLIEMTPTALLIFDDGNSDIIE